jgi:hypothetical protein
MGKAYCCFLLLTLLSSCKFIFTKVYGFNKQEPKFSSRSEYLDFLERKKKIPRNALLIPDSASFTPLFTQIVNDRMGVFYGSFLNDTTILKKSENLKENLSCMGLILHNIKDNLKGLNTGQDTLLEKSNFNNFSFREATTNKVYKMNVSKKPLKIILLYSHSTGNYFTKLYKEILEFASEFESQVELKIISLDYVAQRLVRQSM